jgi:hypothetical protein
MMIERIGKMDEIWTCHDCDDSGEALGLAFEHAQQTGHWVTYEKGTQIQMAPEGTLKQIDDLPEEATPQSILDDDLARGLAT